MARLGLRLAALTVGLLGAAAPPAGAQVALGFLHNPALSPDGATVAFEWRGDLWSAPTAGGAATRLTSHPASDMRPQYSPDGTQLLFTSSRHGGTDVYVMPASGGEPRRLTSHPATDTGLGFTPDGRSVYLSSTRWGHPVDGMRMMYQVPLAGGTPRRLHRCLGSSGALSPDGTEIVFVRHGGGNERRGYRGPASGELWKSDLLHGTFTRLTTNDWPDEAPAYSPDGEWIYYISEQGGRTRNLWRMRANGRDATPLTAMDEPLFAFSVSGDGRTIVFECEDRLWLMDARSGRFAPLAITGPADRIEPEELFETRTSGAGDYSVNPAGTEVAFTVRGDIYVTRFPAGGPTRQLTNTPEVESQVVWHPDGKSLWFVSDKYGQTDLFALASADPAEPRLRRARTHAVTRLTETRDNEGAVQFSPDGQRVLYLRGVGDVIVARPDLSGSRAVFRHFEWSNVRWSPDSRWLALQTIDRNYNSDVHIVSADGGTPVNVSMHPALDFMPAFTGDGTKLAWLSRRNNDQTDVYYVWLRRADYERTRAERDEAADDAYDKPKPPGEQPAAGNAGQGRGQGQPAEAKPIEIEFDGLHQRLVRLTSTLEDESSLAASPRSDELAYVRGEGAARELVLRSPDGPERPIAGSGSASNVTFSGDGRRIQFVRPGGTITSAATNNLRPETVSFSAEVRRDLRAERLYVFEAAWRTMRDEFYDPKMHGVDWDDVRRRYAPRAAAAPTRDDFNRVVNQMLGELNSSHQGFSGGVSGTPAAAAPPPPAGDLGLLFTDERGTGLVVEEVVEESPAWKLATQLVPGDRLLSVDGTALEPNVELWQLLLNKTGVPVRLEVANADGARREVVVRPVSFGTIEDLRYEQWLRWSQAQVTELSGGRLGWTHIRSMSDPSTQTFIRDLFAAGNGKDGLLIDVRWNGGGSTADIILAMIQVQPHAVTRSRFSPLGYPYDRLMLPPWTGKAAMLCNYSSISNAEILTHAFQVLQRGPVIGTPTYGGVLSTGATVLVDGSLIRLPGRGWYRVDNGLEQENHPARPEVEVWFTPEDEVAGRDPQLEAAVAALLKTLD